ncbi:MAG TPA: hypothetical protein VEU06_05755 [Micropepsaceae bacterium]|nr:hypothetical protein [Micropepsaceae bacterium]
MTLVPQYDPPAIAWRRQRPLDVKPIQGGWSGYASRHRAKRCRLLAEQAEKLAAEADTELKFVYLDLTRELLVLIEDLEEAA